MSSIEFYVAGRPQQRGSKRPVRNQKTGATIMLDDNARSKPWMAAVAAAGAEAMHGESLLEGPLSIKVYFWFKRPKSHYHVRKSGLALRADAPASHASTPDADKLMRAVGDALSGVVYRDDSQLAEVFLTKRYTEGSEGADVKVLALNELSEGGR